MFIARDRTPGLVQNPVAKAAAEAGRSAAALYSAMGDTIQSGTATASQYLQEMTVYITDQETLLAALESLAASGSGAAAWASPQIGSLRGAIGSEVASVYSDGGTISGLPESSVLAGIPGNRAPAAAILTNDINPAATPGGTDSAAASSGQAGIGPDFGPGFGTTSMPVSGNQTGTHIEQAGSGNARNGSWLDAMGESNSQFGFNLLAIGSFNLETGSFDVVAGNSNTISGSHDTALGNNDTINGDSARIYGSGLSASTGQTVFGTASNHTVINADGTWSMVVNSKTISAGTSAWANNTIVVSEVNAASSAYGAAKANNTILSSQLSALGWSQVVSSISADMEAGSFGGMDFTTPAYITTNSDALLSDVNKSVDSANTSIHIDRAGPSGDGYLNDDGAALERAVAFFNAHPDYQAGRALEVAEETYIGRLQYDNASSGAITGVEDAVDKAIDTTSYGKLTFKDHAPTVSADIEWALGYALMMNKFGPQMTPGQIGQSDTVTFEGDPYGAYAVTGNRATTANPSGSPYDWETLAGHEHAWEMEAPQYDKDVKSQFGEVTGNNTSGILLEDAENYLMRHAVPGHPERLSAGEKKIDDAISRGQFTLDDLSNAFFGGDKKAEQKIFAAFSNPGSH